MIVVKRPNTILLTLSVISESLAWLFAYGGNQQISSLASNACSNNNTYPRLTLVFGVIALLLTVMGIITEIKNKHPARVILWISLSVLVGVSGAGAFFVSSFCLTG